MSGIDSAEKYMDDQKKRCADYLLELITKYGAAVREEEKEKILDENMSHPFNDECIENKRCKEKQKFPGIC